MALYRLALDRLIDAGFTPVIPPVLVREKAMYGTGFFPSEDRTITHSVPKTALPRSEPPRCRCRDPHG